MAVPKKPTKPVAKKPKPTVKPWDSAIPKDTIGEAVRGTIRGELLPYEAQEQQAKGQLAGNLKWYGDTNTAFQNAMRGIQASSNVSAASMLRNAANRQVAHDREQNSALEFLRSTLLGDTGGPQRNLHLGNDRLNAVKNVENRGLAGQIALNNQSNASMLSGMRGTGHMTTVDNRNRARSAFSDMLRQLSLGKAAAIAKAPALYRQYGMEEAAAQAAFDEMNLKDAMNRRDNATDIWIAKNKAAADAEAATGKNNAAAVANRGAYWQYGIDKKHDKALTSYWQNLLGTHMVDDVVNGVKVKVSESNMPKKKPWRTVFRTIRGLGLTPDQAAMLTTRWIGRTDKKSTEVGWLNMLQSKGVSLGVQKSILKRMFGPGAYRRAIYQRDHAARDAVRGVRNQASDVSNLLGSFGSSGTQSWS